MIPRKLESDDERRNPSKERFINSRREGEKKERSLRCVCDFEATTLFFILYTSPWKSFSWLGFSLTEETMILSWLNERLKRVFPSISMPCGIKSRKVRVRGHWKDTTQGKVEEEEKRKEETVIIILPFPSFSQIPPLPPLFLHNLRGSYVSCRPCRWLTSLCWEEEGKEEMNNDVGRFNREKLFPSILCNFLFISESYVWRNPRTKVILQSLQSLQESLLYFPLQDCLILLWQSIYCQVFSVSANIIISMVCYLWQERRETLNNWSYLYFILWSSLYSPPAHYYHHDWSLLKRIIRQQIDAFSSFFS